MNYGKNTLKKHEEYHLFLKENAFIKSKQQTPLHQRITIYNLGNEFQKTCPKTKANKSRFCIIANDKNRTTEKTSIFHYKTKYLNLIKKTIILFYSSFVLIRDPTFL